MSKIPELVGMSKDNKQNGVATPHVGTPSFDEPDAAIGEVPKVGPTPNHAQNYVGPRTLPKTSAHRTLEIETVKVKPRADPGKALTVKNLRTLNKEAAAKAAAEHRAALAASNSVTPSAQTSSDASSAKRTGGIAVALIAGVLLMLVIVLMSSSSQPPAEPTMGTVDLAAAPAAQTNTEPSAPATTTPSEPTAAAPAKPSAQTPTTSRAVPASKPAPEKPKSEPVAAEKPEAKPIFTGEGEPGTKPAAKPKEGSQPLFE